MTLFFDTIDRLTPQLRAGNLVACETDSVEALISLPNSPFHLAAELDITNDPRDIASHFEKFILTESKRFDVRAVYTEMNGFDINPDRWYCDLFAYNTDGGVDDFDWLSEWQSEYFHNYTIAGLEDLQAVFASDDVRKVEYRDAADLAGLVVVAKFQRFMQLAASSMTELRFPLYATAHDYDYIARIVPE